MSTYLFYMYKNSEYAKAEKSRVTQNRSYMFATVGLLSLINKFSCLVATSDFDRLQCLIESMLSQVGGTQKPL